MWNKLLLVIKRPLIKSFISLGMLRAASLPLSLVVSVLLARELGPEKFGQYVFVMTVISMLSLPVAGGIPALLTREVAVFSHKMQWGLYRGVLRFAHVWVSVFSLIVLAVFLSLSGWLPNESKWKLMTLAVFILPFTALAAVRDGALKGLAKPFYSELPKLLIQPALLLIAFLYLLSTNRLSVENLIYSQIIVAFIIFVLFSLAFLKLQPAFTSDTKPEYHTKQWGRALLPFTLLALVSSFNTQISLVLLGVLSTDDQVAAMRVAERGAQFVVLSLTLVNLVVAPYFAKAWRDQNKEQLQHLARQAARVSFAIALPIGLILLFGGQTLLGWVFGDEYALSAYYPMTVLVIGQLFNVFCGSVGYLLSMSGHERDTLKGQLVAVFLNVLLCAWLIPHYGAAGASVAVAVSIVIWNFVLLSFVYLRLSIIPCFS